MPVTHNDLHATKPEKLAQEEEGNTEGRLPDGGRRQGEVPDRVAGRGHGAEGGEERRGG